MTKEEEIVEDEKERHKTQLNIHGPRRAKWSRGGANIWGKNVPYHGWATKKIFIFLHPQKTLKC